MQSPEPNDIFSLSKQLKPAEKLPLQLQLGWGTAVTERVIGLFSRHFRSNYLYDHLFPYAWDLAAGRSRSGKPRIGLKDKMESMMDDAEEEGYPRELLFVGLQLIDEIEGETGSLLVGMEYAGYAYTVYHLFRQGFSPFDPGVPDDYIDAVQVPFFQFALAALNSTKSKGLEEVRPGMLNDVSLEMSVPALTGVRPGKEWNVPKYEKKG